MTRQVAQAYAIYDIPGDVYRVQRRPAHAHLIVNDDYEGIRVLDARTGDTQLQVRFTPGYDSSGIIDTWCFRADGLAALAINVDGQTAALLSLDGGPSYDLAWPSDRLRSDLRYYWDSGDFWVTGGNSYGFFRLEWQDGKPVFAEGRGVEARIQHRRWRRVVDSLPSFTCNVLRVEPDNLQMLYHDFTQRPGRVGVASWRALYDDDEESVIGDLWSAPAPPEVPNLAFLRPRMFVLQEYEVQLLNKSGDIEATYPAPEGSQNVGFDTLPARGSDPAALVVVSSSLVDPSLCKASIYHLTGTAHA